MNDELKSLNVGFVPKSFYWEIKILAARNGMTIAGFVRTLLQRELTEAKQNGNGNGNDNKTSISA